VRPARRDFLAPNRFEMSIGALLVRLLVGTARPDGPTYLEENDMPKYVLAYHGGRRPESPAEQAKVMDAWIAWFGTLGDAVVDGGNPTGAAKTVSSDGSITDGGGANPLNGYSLVTATDLNAAVGLAKGCPILSAGGSVEVAEAIDM
jgi:hypothetical protein